MREILHPVDPRIEKMTNYWPKLQGDKKMWILWIFKDSGGPSEQTFWITTNSKTWSLNKYFFKISILQWKEKLKMAKNSIKILWEDARGNNTRLDLRCDNGTLWIKNRKSHAVLWKGRLTKKNGNTTKYLAIWRGVVAWRGYYALWIRLLLHPTNPRTGRKKKQVLTYTTSWWESIDSIDI